MTIYFEGFQKSTFDSRFEINERLRELWQTLVEDPIAGIQLRGSAENQHRYEVRQCDFDIEPLPPKKWRGNLGVANWAPGKIASKLVVGSRSRAESEHLLKRAETPEVISRLEQPCLSGRFRMDLHIRLFFNRMKEPAGIVLKSGPTPCEAKRRWPEALARARHFHGRKGTEDLHRQFEEFVRAEHRDPHEAKDREELMKLSWTPGLKLFSRFVFFLERSEEELVQLSAHDQLNAVREDLASLIPLVEALTA